MEEVAGGAAVLVDPLDVSAIAEGSTRRSSAATSSSRPVSRAPASSPGSGPRTRSSSSGESSREARRLRRGRPRPAAHGRRDVRAQPPPRARRARSRRRHPARRDHASARPRAARASSRSSSRPARRSCAWRGRCRALLRRLGADLVHTQYAVPLRCPCPAVVTVHDVSFARDADAHEPEGSARLPARRAARGASGRARPHRVGANEGRPRASSTAFRRSASS